MNRKEHIIIATGLVLLAALYLMLGVGLWQHAMSQQPNVSIEKPPRTKQKDWRPDIRHCFVDDRIVLWDCIRHKDELANSIRERMYREDI